MKVTRESGPCGDGGTVLTFDDVTELVSAQRTSAWADVARRIAHEIKNPLTPIHTFRRSAPPQIRQGHHRGPGDVRQADGDHRAAGRRHQDHGRRVRRVRPDAEAGDGAGRPARCRTEPVILFREGHPQVKFVLAMPEQPISASFDRRLITQAVTNLVKNATEAVETAAASADVKSNAPGSPAWRRVSS